MNHRSAEADVADLASRLERAGDDRASIVAVVCGWSNERLGRASTVEDMRLPLVLNLNDRTREYARYTVPTVDGGELTLSVALNANVHVVEWRGPVHSS